MSAARTSSSAWESRPNATLLGLAWPIAVSTVSYSVMTLVGTLFVGRLGPAALAAAALGGTATFAIVCFPLGLLRAAKTVVSQAVGAGRREELPAATGAALAAALVMGLACTALGWPVGRALAAIAASPESGALSASYLWMRLLGAPLVLVAAALREVRYGVGDTRAPMRAAIAANALNVALEWLFVLRLGYGVPGAAWATNVALLLETAMLARAQGPEGFGLGALHRRALATLVRLGLPTAIQFGLEVGAFALLAAMLAALGDEQMAAHQIALQVAHFAFMPPFALGEAASVLAGNAVGAGRDALVRPIARRALWMSTAYTAACSVLFVAAGGAIASAFTPDLALRTTAARLLWVCAAFQIADGANVVARCTLRGTGDVRVTAAIGVATSWLLTPPLAWLLAYRAGLGALGGWIALCGEIVAGAALLWWRLERGTWRAAAAESRSALTSGHSYLEPDPDRPAPLVAVS